MSSSIHKSTIYVIDDDPDVLGSLRFLLEAEGFEVLTFRTPTALLDRNTPRHADCFVIDYKMPSMNGIDLALHLRDLDITTPIILITGYQDASIEKKAEAAGLHHVLRKPHLEESLVSHILQAMENPSLGL